MFDSNKICLNQINIFLGDITREMLLLIPINDRFYCPEFHRVVHEEKSIFETTIYIDAPRKIFV